jgi:hypothetical protein
MVGRSVSVLDTRAGRRAARFASGETPSRKVPTVDAQARSGQADSMRWCVVSLVVVVGGLGCPGEDTSDAGAPAFEPVELGGGYTGCGDVNCQPGQRCEEENLCYLGCEEHRECAPGEICDYQPGLGGTCSAPDIATCGDGVCSLGEYDPTCPGDCPGLGCDDDAVGRVSCGDTTCEPGFYCANPAEGLCYAGCLSVENCGCGRRCSASPGQPGTCTVPIAPDVPMCGDGTCDDQERPQTCPEDCSWAEQCVRECDELGTTGCLSPGDNSACVSRCVASDDAAREAFGFCIFANGGTAACPDFCVDELVDPFDFDGGLP